MGVEPIYVSETVEKTMNPTFRHVDLSACGPGITRLESVTVRVWVKSAKTASTWKSLLELELDLRSLQFLGKSVCYHLTSKKNEDVRLTKMKPA